MENGDEKLFEYTERRFQSLLSPLYSKLSEDKGLFLAEVKIIGEGMEKHNVSDFEYQRSTDVRMEKQDGILNLIKDGIDNLHDKIDDISEMAKGTEEKVGIQNGRVRKLEDWTSDVKEVIKTQAALVAEITTDYKVEKGKIIAVIAVLTLLGGTIIALAISAIDGKIEKGITSAINNYKNINLIEE